MCLWKKENSIQSSERREMHRWTDLPTSSFFEKVMKNNEK